MVEPMNTIRFARLALLVSVTVSGSALCLAQSSPATLTIDPAQIVSPVSPTLYGLMTEEINHSYDGGLYAEMVRNRTVHGSWSGPEGWTLVQRGDAKASMKVDRDTGPSAALPHSLAITMDSASGRDAAGVANAGWWGMAVRPHTTYHGSFYARVSSDLGPLAVELINDASGEVV